MGTIVLLAGLLLAASANPITHSDNTSIEGASDTNHADVPLTDASQFSDGDNTDDNNEEKPALPGDTFQDSDVVNTANSTGDGITSSDNIDSTISTKPDIPKQESNVSDTNEDAFNITGGLDPNTGKENVTEPPDADPSDCKNASEPDHIFLLCTYVCGGDEMLTARNYKRCYLNQTHRATIDLPHSGVHINVEAAETGICLNGECVPTPTAAQTNISLTGAETSISPTVASTSISSSDAPTSASATPAPTLVERAAPSEYEHVRKSQVS